MKRYALAMMFPALISGCGALGTRISAEEQQLLCENDLIEAKRVAASGNSDEFALGQALLKRAEPCDQSGEVQFYQAVLLIREGPQTDDLLPLLETSAKKQYPLAIALLYRIYSEPYLLDAQDDAKAEVYRFAYENLDVAESGYPSLDEAIALTHRLLDSATPGQ